MQMMPRFSDVASECCCILLWIFLEGSERRERGEVREREEKRRGERGEGSGERGERGEGIGERKWRWGIAKRWKSIRHGVFRTCRRPSGNSCNLFLRRGGAGGLPQCGRLL